MHNRVGIERLITKFKNAYNLANGENFEGDIVIFDKDTIFLNKIPMTPSALEKITDEINYKINYLNELIDQYQINYKLLFGIEFLDNISHGVGKRFGQINFGSQFITSTEILQLINNLKEASKHCLKIKSIHNDNTNSAMDVMLSEIKLDTTINNVKIPTKGLLQLMPLTDLGKRAVVLSREDEERLLKFLLNRRNKREYENSIG